MAYKLKAMACKTMAEKSRILTSFSQGFPEDRLRAKSFQGPENHSKPASLRKSGENMRISRSTVERMLQGERKNGDVVRKTAGYARRTNERAQAAVYQVLNPLLNYFYPRTKLVDKTRDEQGKTKKVYGRPAAPGERLPAREEAPREVKDRMRAQRKRLNIVRLKDALTEAVDRLLKTAQRYRQVKPWPEF